MQLYALNLWILRYAQYDKKVRKESVTLSFRLPRNRKGCVGKPSKAFLRDLDFASESANYSKSSILAQSGAYALAQANASSQYVMQLLQ